MPDCTDLPDDPTALARIAVNGSESQDLRNAAWQKLIPIINRIAIDAARAYHCQEIEQEAVGYIWQKLQEGKFEPEKGWGESHVAGRPAGFSGWGCRIDRFRC